MIGRALVTGITGQLGGALTRDLLAHGWSVRGLVRADAAAGLPPSVAPAVGDITDPASLSAAVAGCDVVCHCAAAIGDACGERRMREINVDGTRNVIDAASAASVQRFVYASSVSVYGRKPGTYPEETPLGDAGNPYGNSKIDAEKILLEHGRSSGPAVIVVRPSTVYGPGDRHFLPRIISNLERRRAFLIEDGAAPVNMVHVDDVAALMRLCVEEAPPGSIYNVTGPDRMSWRQLLEQVAAELNLPGPSRHISARRARAIAALLEGLAAVHILRRPPITRFVVDFITGDRTYPMNRASDELGFRPRVRAGEGLGRTVSQLRPGHANAATSAASPLKTA